MKEIEDKVRSLIEPPLLEKGYELHDVQYKKEGHGWILRIFADNSTRSITLDECALISTNVSDILDADEELMTTPYSLEVSSPGLDRLLRNESDFIWALEKTLKVKYTNEEDKKETIEGKLTKVENDTIELALDKKKSISIKLQDIESARRVMKFNEIMPKADKNKPPTEI